MTIAEFIKGRNIDAQVIRKCLERYSEDFQGHISKKSKEIILDEVAVEMLEKRYPMPQLIQVVEDKESREKLIKLHEEYKALLEKYNKQAMLIAQAEAQKLLLEDKELQLQKVEQELALAKEENAKYKPSWFFGLYKKVD